MTASNTSITRYTSEANHASAHEIIDGKIRNIPLLNADNYAPAGSINSNLVDMAQWLRMQMGKGMIDQEKDHQRRSHDRDAFPAGDGLFS